MRRNDMDGPANDPVLKVKRDIYTVPNALADIFKAAQTSTEP